jgi:oxygen-independent coproporphyrinogen-3 oxidase
MAGLYIHIPFCKQRCTYCDFYTEVAPKLIPDLVDALCIELHARKNYLQKEVIDTIYFGGGTPSLLSYKQFEQIFDNIHSNYKVSEKAEITFEANPDDLSLTFLNSISKLPFNRISIGIQSFDDAELKAINRRHTGKQAIEAIQQAKQVGFKNISIDLIYGLPSQNIEKWIEQLEKALSLDVQHLSVYGLTYEEGTKLWKQRKKGEIEVVDENNMIEMYHELLKRTALKGFEAYEISNFAKPNFRSQHNSAYWKLTPYLGIGPSAHSYDGKSRQWNIASTTKYIQALANKKTFFEKEILTQNDKYNDYIMISLRTREGANLEFIEQHFGKEMKNYCLASANKQIELGNLISDNKFILLSPKGIDISNIFFRELIYI